MRQNISVGVMTRQLSDSKQLLPVIHLTQHIPLLAHNIECAIEAGCEGAFIIDHNTYDRQGWERQCRAVEAMRDKYKSFWIGANFLGAEAWQALLTVGRKLGRDERIDGLWLDNAYADHAQKAYDFGMLRPIFTDAPVYGSVAFKYQKNILSIGNQVDNIFDVVDVITTSGSSTGKAPDLAKMQFLQNFRTPHKKIAIASGISIENIDTFLPYADHFLVYSSIATSRKNPNDLTEEPPLDVEKMKALNRAIRGS